MSAQLTEIEKPSHSWATSQAAIQPGDAECAVSAEVIDWDQLSKDSRDRFRTLRATQPEFRTPFFSIEYFDAVQAARGDLQVVLMHGRNGLVGFLPIHQLGQIAVPAGRYFNDAHNVIADPETMLDWKRTLRQCGLKSFDFHAMVGRPIGLTDQSVMGTTESFCASLGNDSRAFLASLERDHLTIRRQEQKTRKMEREIGPIELQIDCRDSELLSLAIQWKRNQYRRTNILDLFTPTWTRDLIHQMHGSAPVSPADSSTRCMLSVLRAGDHVVAMHFGMIERGLLHYWFPVYCPDYSRFSPGTALFKAIVGEASQHGIHCIDMGYGEQPYKRKQTDTITTVSNGCVTASRTHRTWRRLTQTAAKAIKKIPMKESLKHALRRVQPNAGISKLT